MSLIPEGRYKARGKSWGFGKAGTGTEQFAILFELLDYEEGARTITWYGFFNSEENGRRALKTMRICGWNEDSTDVLNPQGLDRNEVELVIEHEERQNGEMQARVRFVNAIGVSLKPLGEEDKDKLASKIKGWLKSPATAGQRNAQRPPARSTSAPARRTEGAMDPGPPEEDDIPF